MENKERPMLNKIIIELREEETVYCESISRFGRSLKELIDIIDQLANRGRSCNIKIRYRYNSKYIQTISCYIWMSGRNGM